MNNDELKKKIVNVLESVKLRHYIDEDNKIMVTSVIPQYLIQTTADALIAAGIGDVKEYKCKKSKTEVFVQEQFAEKHGFTPDCTPYYIAEQYKHRAEVAEKALRDALEMVIGEFGGGPLEEEVKSALEQAEKELAEERKDEN